MTQSLRMSLATIISVLLCNSYALANEIKIEGDAYARLPPDAQETLLVKMKDQGIIAKNDTVKYVGPSPSGKKESLSPALLLTLAPAACKIIAAAKKQDDLGSCAAKKEVAAQDQCKQGVESNFATVETICNAIKLL